MKKGLLGIIALIIVGFAAYSFMGGAENATNASDNADVIKIGHIGTVTGDYSAYGIAEVVAIKMAVDEINDNGGVLGKKLECVYYDNRTRNEDMINAARRLVKQDKVVAAISDGSGLCIAASPVFTRAKVPHVGTLPTNPNVTMNPDGSLRPYNFRICFIDPYQGRILAFFAIKDLKAKKAAMLYDVSSDYSQGLREYFLKSYKEMGGNVVAEEAHRGDDVDFRAQLTKIAEAKPEVLVLPTMGKSLPIAVKQAREMGITVPIIGGDGYGDFMWEIAGDAMNNTYWVSHVAKEDPLLEQFFAKYKQRAGTECQEFMNAVMAYDDVYWIKDAIERAGTTDPVKVRDALEQTKDLKLMHCSLTMDKMHNPKNKAAYILEAKDGKAVFYDKILPDENK